MSCNEVSILEQINQMLTGKTEIGVANAPLTQESRFDTIYTKQERLVAVMHKDNPWLPQTTKLCFWHIWKICHLPVTRLFDFIFKRLFRFHDLPADPEH